MRDVKGPSGLTRDELLRRCGMSDQAQNLVDAHIEAELTEALLSGAIGARGRDAKPIDRVAGWLMETALKIRNLKRSGT